MRPRPQRKRLMTCHSNRLPHNTTKAVFRKTAFIVLHSTIAYKNRNATSLRTAACSADAAMISDGIVHFS